MTERNVTHQQGFAHAMARMHMWLSGNDPDLLADYPQCQPIWVWCLAHNFSIAAGHCRSFDLGGGVPIGPGSRRALPTGIASIPDADWRPGCGAKAP